ncbi:MAG: hypothetical protein M3N06_06515 [Pseudomonadota bacterium]|nr:hypothetical protein [Pseudomonadota bacterium]
MKALPTLAAGVALLAGTAAIDAAPALAQKAQSEIIVYGTDPCPRSTDGEIFVCTHRPETERFRIPPKLRSSGSPQKRNSWVNQSRVFSRQGLTGPQSCSAVGPAGYTGCALQEMQDAASARASDVNSDTAPSK